ncbi:MAG TPA: signal peptide peptidase SppA [Gammaproteobacteria bacterium]|nr:signal peptide peptidase SppA [Gammaproteobacteria bacterium]HIK69960.1 signal peptide peptidase SppA [Pseudomonadales bacterium]
MSYIKRFFKVLWQAMQTAQTVLFGGLALGLAIALIIGLLTSDKPDIADGGALVLNPSGFLVEQKSAIDPQQFLQTGEGPDETLVQDLVDALNIAKTDQRIKLVILNLDNFNGGLMPHLELIADAISDFRESGKKVIAASFHYEQSDLFLAAHADEILLNPEFAALAEGFGAYRTYYKTLLDNFDVSVNLFKVGKYKSAAEPYFRDSMSAEDKEARLEYLNSWWTSYTNAIEQARDLEAGAINQIANNLPEQLTSAQGNLAQLALDTGLVDKLLSARETREYLVSLTGEDEQTPGSYRGIEFSQYLQSERTPKPQEADKIAVITVVGSIIDGFADAGTIGSRSVLALIDKARQDDKVKAIVLRVDSGGGSKTASEVIRRELQHAQEAGIPVVASMGSVAASGGYWISATADRIFAHPNTITGSIGIFGLIPTFEKTLSRYGIFGDGVGTTNIAGAISLDRGIDPVYAELIQLNIEGGYQQFIETVASGRDLSVEQVDAIAQGRVWTGSKALEIGLIDEIGGLQDAVSSAAELAGLETYSAWHIEPDVSNREKILRELTSEIAATLPAREVDLIGQLLISIRKDLDFYGTLNDPMHSYVICESCPNPALQ